MSKARYVSVSTDECGTPEHWLRAVNLPHRHAEPACGLSRPPGLYLAFNVQRVRVESCLLACKFCSDLLQEFIEGKREERGLFDEP